MSKLKLTYASPQVVSFHLSHLLITRTTESAALETFILQRCEESTHVAVRVGRIPRCPFSYTHTPSQTHWFLQAALSDLQSAPHTAAFSVCRRVFNLVQAIIFSDHLPPIPSTSTLVHHGKSVKLKAHSTPAIVGISIVGLAAAMPALTTSFGAHCRMPRYEAAW